MGQSGISILNKVGYSMFWNSMWDNKNLYSRNLKEDLFFNKFFDLIFNDNVSVNIVNFKKKYLKKFNKYNILAENNKYIFNYLSNNNKVKVIPSKIWILKFQKWIIIYKFIYMSNYKNKQLAFNYKYGNNFFYNIKFYKKAVKIIKYNFNERKKYKDPFGF